MAKIKRSQVKTFLQTATTPSVVLSLIGDGVTTGTINYNPEVTTETYIHEDNGTTSIERYAPTLPVEATAINGDAVSEYIDNLRKTRATLDAAETYIVNVWMYETPTDTDKYPAEKQAVSIQIDSFGGDGGVSAKINYTINFIGDPVAGSYDVSDGTFTAS